MDSYSLLALSVDKVVVDKTEIKRLNMGQEIAYNPYPNV